MQNPSAHSSHQPTMYDVARLAGVSHQTVSRVVNGGDGVRPAVRKRVQQAVAMLGYRRSIAAADLAGSHRNTIAIVSIGGSNAHCVEIFIGAHTEALRRSRQTVGSLMDPVDDADVTAALEAILGHRPSALVAILTDKLQLPPVHVFAHRHAVTTVVLNATPTVADDHVGAVTLVSPPDTIRTRDDALQLRTLGMVGLVEAIRCEAGAHPRLLHIDDAGSLDT